MCGERCGVGVEGVGAVHVAFDSAGVGVRSERDYCSELFGECGGYCFVVCKGFGGVARGEGDGLVGCCVFVFSRECFDECPVSRCIMFV